MGESIPHQVDSIVTAACICDLAIAYCSQATVETQFCLPSHDATQMVSDHVCIYHDLSIESNLFVSWYDPTAIQFNEYVTAIPFSEFI